MAPPYLVRNVPAIGFPCQPRSQSFWRLAALLFLFCPLQAARWLAAGFGPAPPLSRVAVLPQRAPARSFRPGLGGECPRGRVSGCPRVPVSPRALPAPSSAAPGGQNGGVEQISAARGAGGRAQPGAARDTKPSALSVPGALTSAFHSAGRATRAGPLCPAVLLPRTQAQVRPGIDRRKAQATWLRRPRFQACLCWAA